jgi:hypothetical protein
MADFTALKRANKIVVADLRGDPDLLPLIALGVGLVLAFSALARAPPTIHGGDRGYANTKNSVVIG